MQPHQRATLSRPDMVLGADTGIEFGDEHARDYREGAIGGGAVEAGGCGCG